MIRLAIISEGVHTWPLYVAQSKRLFESEGAIVEVTRTGSSVQQIEQLSQGGFDIGFQQSDHVVRSVEQGFDLCIFMAHAHAPDLTLVAAPGIHSIADLKNKTIVVDGPHTGYSLLLRRLFKERGFTDDEMRLVEFGGSQERLDAMKRGDGAACFINPPFDLNLLALGYRSLGTTSEFFPDYPGSIAAVRRSWAAAHNTEMLAFIRGFSRAYDWLQVEANREEAVTLLPAHLRLDTEYARRAVRRIYSGPRPSIDEVGLQQVIDVVWDAEAYKAPKGAPGKYMDLSYLQKAFA